jgi:hypothetical protein
VSGDKIQGGCLWENGEGLSAVVEVSIEDELIWWFVQFVIHMGMYFCSLFYLS